MTLQDKIKDNAQREYPFKDMPESMAQVSKNVYHAAYIKGAESMLPVITDKDAEIERLKEDNKNLIADLYKANCAIELAAIDSAEFKQRIEDIFVFTDWLARNDLFSSPMNMYKIFHNEQWTYFITVNELYNFCKENNIPFE